jgi:elongation factor P hydroxylase
MFVVSASKRYFNIKIDNLELDIEPPKLKILKKITALSKSKGVEAIDDLAEAVRMILNKNKTGFKVSEDAIDELDFDQLIEIITEYFKWLGEVRKSPN